MVEKLENLIHFKKNYFTFVNCAFCASVVLLIKDISQKDIIITGVSVILIKGTVKRNRLRPGITLQFHTHYPNPDPKP